MPSRVNPASAPGAALPGWSLLPSPRGCTVKVLGGGVSPLLGGVGLNRCVRAGAVKSGLISGLFPLFLGITLTKGEMTSSDDSGVN